MKEELLKSTTEPTTFSQFAEEIADSIIEGYQYEEQNEMLEIIENKLTQHRVNTCEQLDKQLQEAKTILNSRKVNKSINEFEKIR